MGVSYQTVSGYSINLPMYPKLRAIRWRKLLKRTLCPKPAGAAAGRQADPDRGTGDYFAGAACPSQVAAAVKRYTNLEGYRVLISMIDEKVNHSIRIPSMN